MFISAAAALSPLACRAHGAQTARQRMILLLLLLVVLLNESSSSSSSFSSFCCHQPPPPRVLSLTGAAPSVELCPRSLRYAWCAAAFAAAPSRLHRRAAAQMLSNAAGVPRSPPRCLLAPPPLNPKPFPILPSPPPPFPPSPCAPSSPTTTHTLASTATATATAAATCADATAADSCAAQTWLIYTRRGWWKV